MESPDGSTVSESVIFMATTPSVAGEYVTTSAKKKCKYFGVFFSKHLTIQLAPNFGIINFDRTFLCEVWATHMSLC